MQCRLRAIHVHLGLSGVRFYSLDFADVLSLTASDEHVGKGKDLLFHAHEAGRPRCDFVQICILYNFGLLALAQHRVPISAVARVFGSL